MYARIVRAQGAPERLDEAIRLWKESVGPSVRQQKARQFAQSDDLRQAMMRSGVTGRPEVYFLEEVERVGI